MRVNYEAGAIRDASGRSARPGAVAVESGRVIAAGPADEVRRAAGEPDRRVDLRDRLLIPGLVNAHTHLELTELGPRPHPGDFIAWVRMVMAERPTDPGRRRAAVQRGVELSRAAGVLRVGDIGAGAEPGVMAGAGVGGVSFGELFGIGPPWDAEAIEAVRRTPAAAGLGWQPHAPYSAGPSVYEAAAASGAPVATHLAETEAELAFVAGAGGPFRELLASLGKWDEAFAAMYRGGLSPVRWLLGEAGPCGATVHRRRWLCAHCNYVDDEDIALLARRGASVAYCPRASEYFGHWGHRYRAMLEAGVNVCLGTDSIVCHGTLGVIDEMRRLHARDAADPATLLAMGTSNGARALGYDGDAATFEAGPAAGAGVVALRFDPDEAEDAWMQVLRQRSAVEAEILEEPT